MKFTNKLKLFTVITLVLIVVGMALYGFLGFNQNINYKDAKEVEVKVYNIEKNDTVGIAKTTCESFFDNLGVEYKSFSSSEDEDYYELLRYKFVNDDAKVLTDDVANELEKALKNSLNAFKLEAEVNLNQGEKIFISNIGKICLALGLSIVAIVIYLLFIEKLASTISVVCSGIISSLLFVSLVALTRAPASPYVELSLILAGLLTVVLSAGLVSRFKEEIKNVGNVKMSFKDIADKSVKDSIVRYSFLAVGLIVVSLLLFILGSSLMRIMAIQILIATVASVFSSIVWTPIIWSLIKKDSKSYNKEKTVE